MSNEYVTFAEIDAAMPVWLKWTEASLIGIARQKNSPIPLIRVGGGGRSDALWRSADVISWMARKYKNAPELASEFAARLQSPTPEVKKTKGPQRAH